MTTDRHDSLLEMAFASARSLEPTDAEVARVLTRARSVRRLPARPNWRRLAPAILAALVLLAGGGYAAVPPVRAAIDDVTNTFDGWLGGDPATAPGRPLGAEDEAPAYFRDPRYTKDPRVIAEADGYKLFAARAPGGGIEFDLGDTGVGLGETSGDVFRDHALVVLGPGAVQNADEHGHVPLFGITARSVKSVELTYSSGPPLRVDGIDGGFVLLAQPERSPIAVVARGANGDEVGRQLIDDSHHDGPSIDWTQYGPPAPRVPSRCQPGVVGLHPPPGCPNG
jgi:hypothetical protein